MKDTAGISDRGSILEFTSKINVSGNAFDVPGKAYVTFPLKKDKIFAMVGFGWGQFQDPPVAPGGGITWLITDKLRLQAVFPKPALVYQPNDDWDLRH